MRKITFHWTHAICSKRTFEGLNLFITGKAFDTTWPLHHAVSNIMAAILHGNRFEYTDPQFKGLVDRTYETYSLLGTASIQVMSAYHYNLSIYSMVRILGS